MCFSYLCLRSCQITSRTPRKAASRHPHRIHGPHQYSNAPREERSIATPRCSSSIKPNFAWCWCELDLLCPSPSPTPSRDRMLSRDPGWKKSPTVKPRHGAGDWPLAPMKNHRVLRDPSQRAVRIIRTYHHLLQRHLSALPREKQTAKNPRVWLIFLPPTSFGENQKESLGAVNLYLTNPYRNRHISEGPGAAATLAVSTFNLLQLRLAGLTDPKHAPGTRWSHCIACPLEENPPLVCMKCKIKF